MFFLASAGKIRYNHKKTKGGDPMTVAYVNGRVYTGRLPLQQAFLVEDGKFTLVGSNEEILARAAGETVDLKDTFVCAGFNDSHMHLLNLGQVLSIAQLAECTSSLEDMLACLRGTPPGRGGWILGRGWNQDLFSGLHEMPTRHDLDRVSQEYPVCAVRACGHALSVNSKALELLGITANTAQPEGGQILMEDGCPNGIFLDNAMPLVLARIPLPDKEEIKEMLRRGCQALNRQGITSCHSDDYSTLQQMPWQTVNEAYRELEAAGELTVRVYEQANFTTAQSLREFIAAGNHTGVGSDFFRIGPLKMLGDGALGARTAFLSQPYADDPSTRGLCVFPPEAFDEMIGLANEAGMQVAIHCIGDACLDLVLNSIEKALEKHPRKDHRHGIVHCQITRADQLERINRLGLHIYAQSIFLDYDIHIVRQRAGDALAKTSYRWKTLMEGGATVSNGSDCPVEWPNVLGGIQCAVTRCDLRGVGPYHPEEAFTVAEALDSFTSGGAWASFQENGKGRIAPGMLADFVILGENPFEISLDRINAIPVLATYLAGKEVFSRVNA